MPSTIIDELIVTLGLDAKKFTVGQREAIEQLRQTESKVTQSAGKIDGAQKRTGDSLGKTGKAAATTSKAVRDGEARSSHAMRRTGIQAARTGDSLGKTGKAAATTSKAVRDGEAKSTAAMHRTGTQATRTASTLLAKGREGAGFFKGLTEAALGFGLALTGVRTVQDALATMSGAAALGQLAGNAGIATSKLSAFGLAVNQSVGGNADTASASLAGLVSNIEVGLVSGHPTPQMSLLTHLGISLQTALHHPLETMKQLAHLFHNISKIQANAYGHLLGFDQGTINFLEQGRVAVEANLAAARKAGVINGHAAREMQKLSNALAGVDAATKTLGRSLLVYLAPGLIRIANAIKDLEEGNWSGLNKDLAPAGHQTMTGALRQSFFGTAKSQHAAARQAVSYFESQGYTRKQAIGLTANIQAESSYDPSNYNPKDGGHWGIGQWSSTRAKQILAATGINVKTASYSQQLKAMAWELTHTYSGAGAALKKTKTSIAAAVVIRDQFEKPGGNRMLGDLHREAIANRIESWLTKKPPIPFNPSSLHTGRALPASVTAYISHLRALQPHHTLNDNRSHAETHIGTVNVNTKATDAYGVAGAVRNLGPTANLALQANRGMF